MKKQVQWELTNNLKIKALVDEEGKPALEFADGLITLDEVSLKELKSILDEIFPSENSTVLTQNFWKYFDKTAVNNNWWNQNPPQIYCDDSKIEITTPNKIISTGTSVSNVPL